MDNFKKEIVKDIAGILLAFIPGGSLVKGTAGTAATIALSRRQKSLVERIAARIFDELYESVNVDSENPGVARSAAYDVMETIRKANVTPELIVDCDLDSGLLYERIMTSRPRELETGSRLRNQLHQTATRKFCVALIAEAWEIDSLQLLISQRLLHNQREILQKLGNTNS